MSWALRFVVTRGEYESQQVPILHVGYLANSGECAAVSVQKHDGVRCRCEMTNVPETCRNEKHDLLPNSFCNTVRKALSVLAKFLIGENHLLMDGRKIQNFRSYEKQLTKATTKTKSEFQSHTFMWTMDRNRSWKAELSVLTIFCRHSDIFSI